MSSPKQSALRVFAAKLRGFFSAQRHDEFDDEMQEHLRLLIERFESQGMPGKEAATAARRQFGNLTLLQEDRRGLQTFLALEALWRDLRYSYRALRKNPLFSFVAVMTLALGIAANATIFSWISSTLLNPIPGIAHTGDLVSVMRGETTEHPTPPFSYPDYRDLREQNRSFAGLLVYHDDFMSITGTGKPERIYGAMTSSNYFDVLGARMELGRGFVSSEEQPGGPAVAVISYALWQTHFGGDEGVIGKTVQVNKHPYTIVGVAPRDFRGCKTGLRADVWIPVAQDHAVFFGHRLQDRGSFWLNALGKLRPGVTQKQANAELNLLMQGLARRYPEAHTGTKNQITLDPLWRSPFGINVYLYKMLPMLLGLAGALLLLACANVANLMLVRSAARRREIVIRLSVGATPAQLVRQRLVESLMLGVAGGAVAVLITAWTSRSLAALFPPTTLPLTHDSHVDVRVLALTIALSILTALVFGIWPAVRSSSVPLQAVLKEEAGSVSVGFHKNRLSSSLVVTQIALSLLLLVCAGLFTRSLQKAEQQDAGFDPEHVLLASYELGPSAYTNARAIAFDQQVMTKVAALPSVEEVTLADFSPLSFSIHSDFVSLEGYIPQPNESMEISRGYVGPNYFHTLRTSLIAGRDFTEADVMGRQPVCIVNQALADRYWPGQAPIGKRVNDGIWFTVVGVARNAKYRLLTYPPEPVMYFPMYQSYHAIFETTVHVRVKGDPKRIAVAVGQAVHELDAGLPVFNVQPMTVTMKLGTIFQRASAIFATSFGFLALLLAGVGIYGVVAYTTRQRTREIGIRMALGAQRRDVVKIVLGQAALLAVIGVVIGLAAAAGLTRLMSNILFGVSSTDPLTFALVAVVLTLVALAACYVPARRATRVDPLVALKYE